MYPTKAESRRSGLQLESRRWRGTSPNVGAPSGNSLWRQAIRGLVEGLRFSPQHGRALARALQRCRADVQARRGAATAGYPGWSLHLRYRPAMDRSDRIASALIHDCLRRSISENMSRQRTGRTAKGLLSVAEDQQSGHAFVYETAPNWWSGLSRDSKWLVFGVIAFLAIGASSAASKDLEEDARDQNRIAPKDQSPLSDVDLIVMPPVSDVTPQLSKEYIYAGSRLLAVEDANANAAPPADVAIWRPSTGTWWVMGGQSSRSKRFNSGAQTETFPFRAIMTATARRISPFSGHRPTPGILSTAVQGRPAATRLARRATR